MFRLVIPYAYTPAKQFEALKRFPNATCSIFYSIYALKTPLIQPVRKVQTI